MTENYWQGKRAVVTGGAGFVGHQLVRLLLEADASVLVLDDFSRGTNKIDGALYLGRDAGNWRVCVDAMVQAGDKDDPPDVVFNLAAYVAGVEFNQSHNARMFWENMRLQSVPLQVAAELEVPRFVQVSTVCVYSPEHNHPCREENGHLGEPSSANAGYAWAKRMGERLAMWYAEETPMECVIVRPSNVFGVGDYYDERAHVIPAMIRKFAYDDPVVLNGSGNEVREFIYSEDLARGMMAAAEHGESGEAYNLGSKHNRSTMWDLAESINDAVANLLNREPKHVEWRHLFSGGDDQRWSVSDKAYWQLGHWEATRGWGALKRVAWQYLGAEGLLP